MKKILILIILLYTILGCKKNKQATCNHFPKGEINITADSSKQYWLYVNDSCIGAIQPHTTDNIYKLNPGTYLLQYFIYAPGITHKVNFTVEQCNVTTINI